MIINSVNITSAKPVQENNKYNYNTRGTMAWTNILHNIKQNLPLELGDACHPRHDSGKPAE